MLTAICYRTGDVVYECWKHYPFVGKMWNARFISWIIFIFCLVSSTLSMETSRASILGVMDLMLGPSSYYGRCPGAEPEHFPWRGHYMNFIFLGGSCIKTAVFPKKLGLFPKFLGWPFPPWPLVVTCKEPNPKITDFWLVKFLLAIYMIFSEILGFNLTY